MPDVAVSELEVVADSQVLYLHCPKCPSDRFVEHLNEPVTVSDIVATANKHVREAHRG